MNFTQAILSGFKHYVVFTGRASRSAFWFWMLFIFILNFVLGMIEAGIMHVPDDQFHPLTTPLVLALFLPNLSVQIRRLHDVNRSGWWVLIGLTGIGVIPLIIWACMKGTSGTNSFGADPLA